MTFCCKAMAEAWLLDHGYRRHPLQPDTWWRSDEDAVVRLSWNSAIATSRRWSIDFHSKD